MNQLYPNLHNFPIPVLCTFATIWSASEALFHFRDLLLVSDALMFRFYSFFFTALDSSLNHLHTCDHLPIALMQGTLCTTQ